jgi:hypothetical protein
VLDLVRLAALDQRDVALVEEIVGGFDRGGKVAARIVAQVEDKADQLTAGLLAQILDRGGEQIGRRVVETGEADVTDVAVLEFMTDGRERPGDAFQRYGDQSACAGPLSIRSTSGRLWS